MVRVGVVGLGQNGIAHIDSHLRVGRSRIVALCDSNPERLQAAGKMLGIDRLHRDAAELCSSSDIDAVSINTGDPSHADPFVRAVRAGKHVLVEKPVANSDTDIEAMVRAAREATRTRRRAGLPPLVLAVGYILRFNPVYEAIHSACVKGELGRIFYMEADYVHNLLYQAAQTDPAGGNWYLDDERPMVGGGSHPLDLLRWMSGAEVVETAGFSNRIAFPAMRHDDCQVALFRFSTGAVAKVAALYAPRCAMAPFYNLRLYGTRGTVERDRIALARDEADVHPSLHEVDAARVEGHPYDPEVGDWLDAIERGGRPRCDFFDGANSTIATLAACRAMSGGGAESVPVYSGEP